jgi:hypothetical protein
MNDSIPMTSRRNDPRELQEMTTFASWARALGVAWFVRGLFYDSNSQCCMIETDGVTWRDGVHNLLVFAARVSLTQYELLGVIGHGNPLQGALPMLGQTKCMGLGLLN